MKETIKRTYVTPYMQEFLFESYLQTLNKGIIFKDTNTYNPFSKYNLKVINFFVNYFTKESLDLQADLDMFLTGMLKYVTHPQMMLCCFKTFMHIEKHTKFLTA